MFKNEGECFLNSKNHYQTESNNWKSLKLLEWLTSTFCIQFKIMVVLTISSLPNITFQFNMLIYSYIIETSEFEDG